MVKSLGNHRADWGSREKASYHPKTIREGNAGFNGVCVLGQIRRRRNRYRGHGSVLMADSVAEEVARSRKEGYLLPALFVLRVNRARIPQACRTHFSPLGGAQGGA